MENKEIHTVLDTEIQNTREKNESSKRRKINIEWIKNLSRDGLRFQEKEKQLLIAATDNDEELYIQYPGKETSESREKIKPWDFRPVIFLPNKNNYFGEISSFIQIWSALFDTLETIKQTQENKIRILATVFYRMAFMLDHQLPSSTQKLKVKYVSIKDNEINERIEKFDPWYRYSPPKQIITEVTEAIPSIGGISLEGFLHYNDILAWNEDCKYYYRNLSEKKGKWIGATGRINNLLTHIAIIGFVLNDIKLAEILGRFTRTRGVSAPTNEEIVRLCKDFVNKKASLAK